jgi:hypothetical protein
LRLLLWGWYVRFTIRLLACRGCGFSRERIDTRRTRSSQGSGPDPVATPVCARKFRISLTSVLRLKPPNGVCYQRPVSLC